MDWNKVDDAPLFSKCVDNTEVEAKIVSVYDGEDQYAELESNYSELISGTKSTRITDRKPSGSCTIESVPLGTKNYYTIVNSSATGNLTWQHGQSAGNPRAPDFARP